MKELKQIKYKDLKKIRLELLKKQKYKCKICGCKLSVETPKDSKNCHLDHQHYGKKLIRAVLCRRCNTCEGKLWNSYVRTTLKTKRDNKDYINMLKGLLKYASLKPTNYIHPKAIRKKRKIKRRKKR